jgi:hypothetical protein
MKNYVKKGTFEKYVLLRMRTSQGMKPILVFVIDLALKRKISCAIFQ